MTNALRRMPIAAEMDIFEREVRGDDQLLPTPRPYHRTIVTDAQMQNPARVQLSGAFANGCNQFPFAGCLWSAFFALGSHGASIPCPVARSGV
jgi:hypothetical protein